LKFKKDGEIDHRNVYKQLGSQFIEKETVISMNEFVGSFSQSNKENTTHILSSKIDEGQVRKKKKPVR